jgi:hypothetical protein
MPSRLRRLLHRAFHLLAHPRNAEGKGRGITLRPAYERAPMRDLREAGAACGLLRPKAQAGDVPFLARGGPRLPLGAGEGYRALTLEAGEIFPSSSRSSTISILPLSSS